MGSPPWSAGLQGQLALVGLGALATFVGVAVLSPVLARPFAKLFGLPLRARGLTGELATRNAMRNPKRTARTAASLMIGVALVGFITVFAASAKTSLAGSLETDFTGTHIVETGGWDNSVGLSPDLADQLRATPGVDVVSQARTSPAIVDGSATDFFSAFDATTVGEVFALGSVEGDLDSLGADGIAVSAEEAASKGWTLGSEVPVTFPGGDTTLVVEAIYSGSTDWVGPMFVDLEALRANGGDDLDYRVYVSGDEDAITGVAAAYGSAEVLDKEAFLGVMSGEIDTMLGLFYALLMLAVVIALLGIANTLALSIFERTRELGPAAGGRDGTFPGAGDGPLGVDHHRRVRHDARPRDRHLLRVGDRPGDGRPGHRHAHRAVHQPGSRDRDRRQSPVRWQPCCRHGGPPSSTCSRHSSANSPD